jgi:hypothetical protein
MLITNRWLATSLTLLWAWGGFFANVASGGPSEPGRGVYQMRCQSCHGPDGLASPQMEKMLKVPHSTGHWGGPQAKERRRDAPDHRRWQGEDAGVCEDSVARGAAAGANVYEDARSTIIKARGTGVNHSAWGDESGNAPDDAASYRGLGSVFEMSWAEITHLYENLVSWFIPRSGVETYR